MRREPILEKKPPIPPIAPLAVQSSSLNPGPLDASAIVPAFLAGRPVVEPANAVGNQRHLINPIMPVQTGRVQAWRLSHPGYWRRKRSPKSTVKEVPNLSSLLSAFALQDTYAALQDSWPPHLVAILGLIARLRGTALQDIIAEELSEVMLMGHAILETIPRPTKPVL